MKGTPSQRPFHNPYEKRGLTLPSTSSGRHNSETLYRLRPVRHETGRATGRLQDQEHSKTKRTDELHDHSPNTLKTVDTGITPGRLGVVAHDAPPTISPARSYPIYHGLKLHLVTGRHCGAGKVIL